jgi:hypothetical protein
MWRAFCRISGVLALGVLLTLGVMAQASATEVRAFEDIQASEIVITPDPGGRSAVLEVLTSVDAACSVVYGTDETFGLIATDSDMGGGATTDHAPVLGGLEPETDYVYRLQGTTPDGTLYVSEVMTFSTPAAAAGGPPNLALDAVVTGASSEFSDAFAAANAFDGDGTTEWSSRGDGDDAWVEIDLGSPQAVEQVVFRTRSMRDGTATALTYEIAADGQRLGEFAVDGPADLGIEAQVLRFDIASSTGGNTGAVEILVLGPEAP